MKLKPTLVVIGVVALFILACQIPPRLFLGISLLGIAAFLVITFLWLIYDLAESYFDE